MMMQQLNEKHPPEKAVVAVSNPAATVQTPQVSTGQSNHQHLMMQQIVIKEEEDELPKMIQHEQKKQYWPETFGVAVSNAAAVHTLQMSTDLTPHMHEKFIKEEDQPPKIIQEQRKLQHLPEAARVAASNSAAAVQTPQKLTGLTPHMHQKFIKEEDQPPKMIQEQRKLQHIPEAARVAVSNSAAVQTSQKSTSQRVGKDDQPPKKRARRAPKNNEVPLKPVFAAAWKDEFDMTEGSPEAMAAVLSTVTALKFELLELAGCSNEEIREMALEMCETFIDWLNTKHIYHPKNEMEFKMLHLKMFANLILEKHTEEGASGNADL